jgi:hypothetical protein
VVLEVRDNGESVTRAALNEMNEYLEHRDTRARRTYGSGFPMCTTGADVCWRGYGLTTARRRRNGASIRNKAMAGEE